MKLFWKSAHWPGRRCRLKGFSIFSFDAILFSGADPFSNLVEGHPRNISVKLF